MSYGCKKIEACSMFDLISSSLRILELYPHIEEYCRNPEKYKECERYKILIEGNAPPENLLPNGRMLNLR